MINDRVYLLTKLSQDLAKEAKMSGVELTLCGRISDYKNVIIEIKEKGMERIKTRSNLTSSPTNLSRNRVLRDELNISSIDSPDYSTDIDSDRVLNPYRLGLNLAVSEHSGDFYYYPTMDQIGTEPNDGLSITGSWNNYHNVQLPDSYRVGLDLIVYNNLALGNPGVNCNPSSIQIGIKPNEGLGITGHQTNYCNAQVFDSYRFGLDLIAYNNIGLGDPSVNCYAVSNQVGTEPNDGLGITGYQPNYHTAQIPDSYRVESDLSAQTKDGI